MMVRRLYILLGALAFVTLGLTTWASAEKLRDIEHQIEQIRVFRTETEQFYLDLLDAETGQRGYLLTGRDSYLDPYFAGQQAGERILHKLQQDESGPLQRDFLIHITPIVQDKWAELRKTIDLLRKGPENAFEVILTDAGKQMMDELRRRFGQFRTDSDAYEAKMALEQQRQSQIIVVEFAGCVILLLLGGLTFLSSRIEVN